MPAASARIQETAQRMLSLGPRRVDHIPAFRIAVGLAIPMTVLLLTDHVSWAMYAGFGAFTGIYSRYEPTALRFRRQLIVGALLTVCVTVGASLSALGTVIPAAVHSWVTLLVSAVVAGLAATLVTWLGLKPAGAVFPLFAVAAVAAAPPAAPIWTAAAVAGASAAGCVMLGLLGHWAGSGTPGRVRPRLARPGAVRTSSSSAAATR